MGLILNLFREGARLRFMTIISDILKDHQGSYFMDLVGKELQNRAVKINCYTKIGRMNSEKTAQSYIANSIALRLHKKEWNKLLLTPLSKALLCLKNEASADPFALSLAEKTLLLYANVDSDGEGILNLLKFLRNFGNCVPRQLVSNEIWPLVFPTPVMRDLKGSARMHRLVPRLEWCSDLGLLTKLSDNCFELTEIGSKVVHLLEEQRTLSNLQLSLQTYWPNSKTPQNPDTFYEDFQKSLKTSYRYLVRILQHAFDVEIPALRFLTLLSFASQGVLLSEKQFNELLINFWEGNLDRVRLSRPLSRELRQKNGIHYRDRVYYYITISS